MCMSNFSFTSWLILTKFVMGKTKHISLKLRALMQAFKHSLGFMEGSKGKPLSRHWNPGYMRMQSLSGTIKSNKHDGLHMQFMSFAAGCMCALSGPNGLGFYSFFSSSSHFLGPASNDQRLPAANNSGSKPLGHFIEVFPSHCLSLSRFFFFFLHTTPL